MSEHLVPNKTILDAKRQEQAKGYARIRRRLMLLDLAAVLAYLLAWLILGWSTALKTFLHNITTNEWLLVAGFGAVFGGIYVIISLPLSYYSGFVLPHRYDLSNQTFNAWVIDQFKGLIIGVLLGGVVMELIYAIIRSFPNTWWLWAAGFMLAFNILLANLAPVLLMPIFYKFSPLGEDHAELETRLLRLAERAGTKVRGVYKFDMSSRTKAANAALTGLGNTRRILLGDTLISEFTTDEIETILAHELAHHVHNDIPIGILVESFTTLIGFYLASLALNWGVGVFGFQGPSDIAAMPLLMLVLGAYGLITMPFGNAFSRWRERRADQYAIQTTGKGAAYASALIRLADQNLADADPEPWVEWLLYSHPSLGKRIRMAQSRAQ